MRIELFDRPDADRYPGGDTVQISAVERYLTSAGHEVRRRSDQIPGAFQADVVLLFGLTRIHELFVRALSARRSGVPYVVFPIYWDLDEVVPGHRRAEAVAARHVEGRVSENVLTWAAAVCPNSEAEVAHLTHRFPAVRTDHFCVVRNGVDREELSPLFDPHRERIRQVVCAGGIGARKNQLNLIRAAQAFSCPLKIVGQVSPGFSDYERQVRQEAPAHAEFTGLWPRARLLAELAHSWVHCQPSFIETPGLVSLEAAALGCNVVVSDTPPVREYFGERAIYVTPHEPRSIAEGVAQALGSQPDTARAAWVLDAFDWKQVLRPLDEILEAAAWGRRRKGAPVGAI